MNASSTPQVSTSRIRIETDNPSLPHQPSARQMQLLVEMADEQCSFNKIMGTVRSLLSGHRGVSILGSAREPGPNRLDPSLYREAEGMLRAVLPSWPGRFVITGGGDGIMGLANRVGSESDGHNLGFLLNLPWALDGNPNLHNLLKANGFPARLSLFRSVSAMEQFHVGGMGSLYEWCTFASANLQTLQHFVNLAPDELQNASPELLGLFTAALHPMVMSPFWTPTMEAIERLGKASGGLEVPSLASLGIYTTTSPEDFIQKSLALGKTAFPNEQNSEHSKASARTARIESTDFLREAFEEANAHVTEYYRLFNLFVDSLHAYPRVAFIGDGELPEEQKAPLRKLMIDLFREGTDILIIGNAYQKIHQEAWQEVCLSCSSNARIFHLNKHIPDFPPALFDEQHEIPADLHRPHIVQAMCTAIVSTVGGIETLKYLSHIMQHQQLGLLTKKASQNGRSEPSVSTPHPFGFEHQTICLGGAMAEIVEIFERDAIAAGTVGPSEFESARIYHSQNVDDLATRVYGANLAFCEALRDADIPRGAEWGHYRNHIENHSLRTVRSGADTTPFTIPLPRV